MSPIFEQLEQWLLLSPEHWSSAWSSALGENLRKRIATSPWQSTLLEERSQLEQALQRVFVDPCDWAAQLVLLTYGRQTEVAPNPPAWLAQWWKTEYTRTKRLKTLPPPENCAVTITLPTYNRLAELQAAVASVQAQSDPDWNLWIGDDGSCDGTEQWCQALTQQDPRITYFRQEQNQGCLAILNLLYAQCHTPLVTVLCDDDRLMPNWLASTRVLFKQYPWIAMAGGGFYQFHLNQNQLHAKQHGPYYPTACIANPRLELQRCGVFNPVFGGGLLIRKSVLETLSQQDPFRRGHTYSHWDWLLTAQALANYEVAYTPEIVAAYVIEAQGANTFSQDWSRAHIYLLECLLRDYEALFGAHQYPAKIIRYFLDCVAEPALVNSFHEHLNGPQSPAEWEHYLQSQRQTWESYRHLRQDVLPQCQHESSELLLGPLEGLTAGEIPGLQQGQTPLPLQNLIQSLMAKLHSPG